MKKPVELPTFKEMTKRHGVYWDKLYSGTVNRYTIYVYMEGEDEVGEEIDVDAHDRADALRIGQAAWKRDYQGNVRKMQVIGPRVGLYM